MRPTRALVRSSWTLAAATSALAGVALGGRPLVAVGVASVAWALAWRHWELAAGPYVAIVRAWLFVSRAARAYVALVAFALVTLAGRRARRQGRFASVEPAWLECPDARGSEAVAVLDTARGRWLPLAAGASADTGIEMALVPLMLLLQALPAAPRESGEIPAHHYTFW